MIQLAHDMCFILNPANHGRPFPAHFAEIVQFAHYLLSSPAVFGQIDVCICSGAYCTICDEVLVTEELNALLGSGSLA